MARRIFAILMLFVLMWTGTFLHDLAEGLEHDRIATTAQSESTQVSGKEVSSPTFASSLAFVLDDTLPPLMSEAASPEHVHLIGVVSKHYVHSAKAQTGSLVFPPLWASCCNLLASANKERAPPDFSNIVTGSNNRLYLANQRLLI